MDNDRRLSVSGKVEEEKECGNASGSLIIVIKIGTSSLIRHDTSSVHLSNMAKLCETVAILHSEGHRVIIVTSGSVGVGGQRLGLTQKPTEIAKKQALAAVGQLHLMRHYDDNFTSLGKRCAQVLLTLDNLSERSQYLNARATFKALFNYGCIPIVNENDTVAVHELRIGDNDTMASQVASLVGADWCFLLTDVDGLYTANPNNNPDAQLIPVVEDISKLAVDIGNTGTEWGTGGMQTKLVAARIATSSGCRMVICNSEKLEEVPGCVRGASLGTLFLPPPKVMKGRKRWILAMPTRGQVLLDAGAVRAVLRGTSLFPAGVRSVLGSFSAQEAVQIVSQEGGQVVAHGLCNYSSKELELLKGHHSDKVKEVLGYLGSDELIHRNNMCVIAQRTEDEEDESDF
mmetsp:Transcript_6585/g.8938  ORF Transcript_6585/g.8938 Transcript_6585/m.8938 type:complete len:402 (+) Transcript_6585:433-1638(+)|eukprot:CAMPEP_0196588866 /NCGR_PEP_ID=MMETSP1081-20130531/61962_1 /TAXON_ID=36882 /ORGANISM="Pyramimonas amylifera, Strain CCMP720" /LENGTH=401 /DNA_ID=CAMNT_0041911497 /DNA_START=427 /DNA_END=1632 /DNA_ORIENTATION=+